MNTLGSGGEAPYLRRYGADNSDPDTKVVRRFVSEYEKVRGQFDIDTAYGAKNSSPEQGPCSIESITLASELWASMRAQLTPLHKSFHNDSDAGLNKLIATVLAKALP